MQARPGGGAIMRHARTRFMPPGGVSNLSLRRLGTRLNLPAQPKRLVTGWFFNEIVSQHARNAGQFSFDP